MIKEQKVWIRGIESRSDEILRKLEKLGGINSENYYCGDRDCIYFIDHDGEINYESLIEEAAKIIMEEYTELKLDPIESKYNFKPYDKILVRDSDDEVWGCDFFSHYEDDSTQEVIGTSSVKWLICIPYNDETAHLVGINKDL